MEARERYIKKDKSIKSAFKKIQNVMSDYHPSDGLHFKGDMGKDGIEKFRVYPANISNYHHDKSKRPKK